MLELGGNIKLVGFSDVDPAKLVVVKKLVGNYARKLSDHVSAFQELSVSLKEIHASEVSSSSKKYELSGKVIFTGRTPITSEVVDYNLFFGLDKTLSKLLTGSS